MAEITAQPGELTQYVPRPQFEGFRNRRRRWSIIVAHRRAGKTVECVMDLLTAGLSTRKPDARYAYIAPFREQAKIAAWTYLQRFATPALRHPAEDIRQSELAVNLPTGGQVRLYGADNPDALRGMYLDGVVMDEVADMRPQLWGEVIRPALSDRNGWAVFIGTPRGRNHFWRMWDESASDPAWFRMMLKASESGIVPESELAEARKQMTAEQYAQEYECSFEAAITGAIYAKELDAAAARITSVPYDGAHLVHTAWDIGVGDDTAIWCFQQVGQEIRIIDFYANAGERATHYTAWLRSRGYHFDTAWLPHDAQNRQMTGSTVAEAVREAGFRVEVIPRGSLEDGINAARMLLPRCWFDRERCMIGLDALRMYRWARNERMGVFTDRPVHDQHSHAADAFRYLAQAVELARNEHDIMSLPPLEKLYPQYAKQRRGIV